MTWSTRELADLAGTTVNTVRHYHSLGILDAPERRYNGYKQYRVHHLVRLIQVRRIVELGVPLARVEAAGDNRAALLDELRQLDAHVAVEIARLHRTRADIAAILRVHARVDTPRGFEAIVAGLSEADMSLIHILTKLIDDGEAAALRESIVAEPGQVRREFDDLQADAREAQRQRVADRMSAGTANWRSAECPWVMNGLRRQGRGARMTREAIVEAVNDLYNPAQRDVLRRVAASASPAPRALPASEASLQDADLLICA